MNCPSCGHLNPADSAFCDNCGSRLAALCPACGAENRTTARFCRGCGNPLKPAGPAVPVYEQTTRLDTGPLDSEPSAPASAEQVASLLRAEPDGEQTSTNDDVGATAPPVAESAATTASEGRSIGGLFGPPASIPPAGAATTVSRMPRSAFKFAGRQKELEQLAATLVRARAGQGQIVNVAGEGGAGKTRLFQELRRTAAAISLFWFEVTAVERERQAALQLVVKLLCTLLGLGAAISDSAEMNAALARILPPEDCPPLAAAVGSLLGISDETGGLEPDVRRRLVMRALQEVLHALSVQRPLVILLDELQWADASSLELLRELAPFLSRLPILLVATFAPPFTPDWPAGPPVTEIGLRGLTAAETGDLLAGINGSPAEPQTVSFLLERTNGNPLFIESLLEHFRTEHYLEEENGAWRLPLRRYLLVPATLDELYRLQIERLGESIRLVLGPAIVWGDPFSLRQLSDLVRAERTWAVPDTLLTSNLERLLEYAVIVPLDELDVYQFRHQCTRGAANEFVPALRASRLHVHAGRLLEQEVAEPRGPLVEKLAFHYGLGDRAPKAVEYYARAAERAMSVQAYPEALAHYRAALARLQELPTGQEKLALSATLHAGLASAETRANDDQNAEAHFRAALAGANDPLVRASIWKGLAALYAQQWRHQDGLTELLQEEHQLLSANLLTDEMGALASARLKLERIGLLRGLGWYADAQQVASEALRALDADDPQFDTRLSAPVQDAVAQICTDLGEVEVSRRQYGPAEQVLRRALAIQEQLNSRKQMAQTCNQLAHIAWLRGDLDVSAEHYQRARTLQIEVGDLRGSALSTHNLALVYWRQWKLSEAEAYLLEALAGLELIGELHAMPAALANLERIYWYRGDFERLGILHEKELALAAEAGWDLTQANELYRGRLAVEHGAWEEALGHLRNALQMAGEQQDETALEASLLLGQALLAGGQTAEADVLLRQALSRALERRQMGSAGLLQLAIAELEFQRGEFQAAEEAAKAAEAIADAPDQRPRLGTRHLLGRYHRLRGRLAAALGHWKEAEAAFEESLALLESIEGYLEAARTCLAWAEALLAHERMRETSPAALPGGAVELPPETSPRIRELVTEALNVFQASGLEPEQEQAESLLGRL